MDQSEKDITERLYKELVGNRIEPLIVKYDIISGDFECHPYRHSFDVNAEIDLTDVLFDNIVFYAFEDSEIANEYKQKRLDNLRKAARVAYKRLPQTERLTDGLLGELLLDAMLRTFYPQTKTIISRVKYIERQPNKVNKIETHGYDALMFSDDGTVVSVWIGQVKTGDWAYCLRGIKDDLNKSVLREYFAGQMVILADYKRGDDIQMMGGIINDINNICFEKDGNTGRIYDAVAKYFSDKKIPVIIPALLLFPIDKYADENEILADIRSKCERSLNRAEIENKENLNIKVVFLVFPVRDLNGLRKRLLDLRQTDGGTI